MPGFLLKRQILINLPSDCLEAQVANSIDFMVERVGGDILYPLTSSTLLLLLFVCSWTI